MRCPYPDCTAAAGDAGEACPTCRRPRLACAACGAANRRLARFCRTCGERQPEPIDAWIGYRGGPERQALNRHRLARPLTELAFQKVAELHFEGACHALLFAGRYLLAVDDQGAVECVDLVTPGRGALRTPTHLVPSAQPCVHRGMLLLAGGARVAAFPLAGLEAMPPRLEARWSVAVDGTPMHALLAVEDRLYLNVGHDDGRRQVLAIDGIDSDHPAPPATVHSGQRLSMLAATRPPEPRVSFLSVDDGATVLHRLDHSDAGPPRRTRTPIDKVPSPLADHLPIAAVGHKVLAVFGADDRLCRLDGRDGVFDVMVHADTAGYALHGMADGVVVHTQGLHFLGRGTDVSLGPVERISTEPLVLRGSAGVVGFHSGRIRAHQLNNPASFVEHRLSDGESEAVAVLASFEDYVAAGGSEGTVALLRLAAPGSPAHPTPGAVT